MYNSRSAGVCQKQAKEQLNYYDLHVVLIAVTLQLVLMKSNAMRNEWRLHK
jgi:hypothetical protein